VGYRRCSGTRFPVQAADKEPDLIVLVAENDDGGLGFVIADPISSELCAVCVRPNNLGRVGSVLLAKAEMLAFQRTKRLTFIASINAVRFYTENGYADNGLLTGEAMMVLAHLAAR
jgi:hypothetical protein